ncbi:LacI family transcriptional regulator [Arthrobacter sp. KBS0703]|uniref:LacI family DNA-binding transcriptional regulator n=1 Tax=Arthrobacter sp. KBS0703 TaxID=1955698 RepID=UPI00098F6A11|nr:LacI family DNA-binding transcriptional regulator [Arthrobacter sp. KBS0703]TSE17397.1 LacI family transcriptional regulator [Arthrobacter sp. KBS0703]
MRSLSNPTIRDVAERAGVSLTTVSYVLSGRSGGTTRISQPTQERVLAAVGDLGYVPNQAARGMRRGRTDLVAIAIGDLEWPPDRALATAAASILPRHGYQPVILLGQTWRQFMLSGGADGVIVGVSPQAAAEDGTITELARRGVAQVVIAETMQAEQAVALLMDQMEARAQHDSVGPVPLKRLSGSVLFGGGALHVLHEVLSAVDVFAQQLPGL